MKFYIRLIFLIIIALVFKIIFDIPFLPEEITSLQGALRNNFLIRDHQKLIINMKKVFKTRNPQNVLDHLLQLGGNIDAEKTNGSTPLIFSTLKGNKEMIIHLLKKGANGNFALSNFILKKDQKAVARLIKCGIDVNIQDESGSTPLHRIIKDKVIDLLASGFNFDSNIDNTITIKDTIKLVKLFLTHGANPNIEIKGKTALSYALVIFNKEFIKLLLEKGANPNIKSPDKDGRTPLIRYVQKNDYEMVKLLLDKGADVNLQDNIDKTALFYVKDSAIATLLVDKCPDINFKGHQGYTALNWSAHQKNEMLVKFLLAKGADATIKNDEGKSALDSVNIQ